MIRNTHNRTPQPAGPYFPVPDDPNAAPRFGFDAAAIQQFTVDLATAKDKVEFPVTGNAVWIIGATSLTASIDIQMNDQRGAAMALLKGHFVAGLPFDRLFLTHTAQAGETITLLVAHQQNNGQFRIENSAEALSGVTISNKPAVRDAGDNFDTIGEIGIATGATTVVLALNAGRHTAIIHSSENNWREVRVSDSGGGANNGLKLWPGEKIQLNTEGAIYIYNPHGQNQTVEIAEID